MKCADEVFSGKILSVNFSESDNKDCLYVVMVIDYKNHLLITWVCLGKDEWNSEGFMSMTTGETKLTRFDRNELFVKVYEHFKQHGVISVAKDNMTVFNKYLSMER